MTKLDVEVLWMFNVGVVVLLVGMAAFFIKQVVVPKHRNTFLSTQTGWERAEKDFLDNEDDANRIRIFKRNVWLWSRIKSDVKEWTLGNWETWEREKPEWFTSKVISSIPDEFIPPRFLAKLGGARERRGSAVHL